MKIFPDYFLKQTGYKDRLTKEPQREFKNMLVCSDKLNSDVI